MGSAVVYLWRRIVCYAGDLGVFCAGVVPLDKDIEWLEV